MKSLLSPSSRRRESLRTLLSDEASSREEEMEGLGLMAMSLVEEDHGEEGGEGLPSHLYILVHGFNSRAEHLNYVAKEMANRLGPSAAVYSSFCNEAKVPNFLFHPTHEGIDTGGARLAQEIREVVGRRAFRRVKYISFLGNSMGGLYIRFALGLLYEPSTGLVAGLIPLTFMTTATPHLGTQALLPKALEKMVTGLALYGGRSAKQLFLVDQGERVVHYANGESEEEIRRLERRKEKNDISFSTRSRSDASARPTSPTFSLGDDQDEAKEEATEGGDETNEQACSSQQAKRIKGIRRSFLGQLLFGSVSSTPSSPSPSSPSPSSPSPSSPFPSRLQHRRSQESVKQWGVKDFFRDKISPRSSRRKNKSAVNLDFLKDLQVASSSPSSSSSSHADASQHPLSPLRTKSSSEGLPGSEAHADELEEEYLRSCLGGEEFEDFLAREEEHELSSFSQRLTFLRDQHRPLLLEMTTDDTLPFLSALRAFKHRVLYGNTCNDFLVRYPTAMIASSFLPRWQMFNPVSHKYPHVIHDSLEEVFIWPPPPPSPPPPAATAGAGAASDASPSSPPSPYFLGDPKEKEIQAMLENLSQLSWRRISARFERTIRVGDSQRPLPGFLSSFALDAHNRLPVVRPFMDGDGKDTVKHICDIWMEHAMRAGDDELQHE